MACGGAQVRDPRDLVPILHAVVGPADHDADFTYTLAPPRATRLADFRVAVWSEDPACPIDDDVAEAVSEAITALRASGAKVVIQPRSLPVDIATNHHKAFLPLVYGAFTYDRTGLTPASNAALLARLVQNPRGDAGPALRGTFQSHYRWLQAHAARNEIRRRWFEFFRDFDVVLMPVTPTAAPAHHNKLIDRFGRSFAVDGVRRSYWDQVKWNAIANISGGPATTIPVRKGRSGLPIGLQALGPSAGDLTTIEFAALLGREVEGFVQPPAFV